VSDVLEKFFYARTLAIVGASTDPSKLGGRAIRHNAILGFEGNLLPVNASAAHVQGLPAVSKISDLPDDVDCAVVALPASSVEAAIEALAARRIPLAIVLSSGFAENSVEGAQAQARLVSIAREGNMRLVGPNSMGGITFENRMSATFTTINEHEGRSFPPLGGVSIASQSGFIGSHLMGILRDRGVGIAKWLATGNEADIDLADVISHYANDAITRVIAVYLEGTARADALRTALELARSQGKPVVAIKAGRSEIGARAAASHTAALVGDWEVYDAVFRRHGVITVTSIEELADVVTALETQREISGPQLGVGTVSGGLGILISDAAASHGFELPELSAGLQAQVRSAYSLSSPRNPVDMGSLVRFEPALEALQEQGYQSLVVVAGHFGLLPTQAEELYKLLTRARERKPQQFIALVACLNEMWRRKFLQLGVFVCEDADRTMRAMAAVRTAGRPLHIESLTLVPKVNPAEALARGDEFSARSLLRDFGIPVVDGILVTSETQATKAALQFGSAVAMKIVSPDLAHKSDVGGVCLGVKPDQAAQSYNRIMENVRSHAPTAQLHGVLVSPMIEKGVETIVGFKQDAVFGPIVLFGLGGVFVDILRDTAIEPAPFGRDTALSLIKRIKGFPLLDGARGRPPADLNALADVLAKLSVFAVEHAKTVDSLEINPLLALPDGVLALDALLAPVKGVDPLN
jgi:acyl-CoA synthetase (NDP forming)